MGEADSAPYGRLVVGTDAAPWWWVSLHPAIRRFKIPIAPWEAEVEMRYTLDLLGEAE